jgi:VIT1/CCC1 family predicted Fe2+/Mn2+ transporter/rubrerythrin
MKRYRQYLRSELEEAAIYSALADTEKDSERAEVFQGLVEAEMRHATRWAEKLGIDSQNLQPQAGGLKNNLVKWMARLLGTKAVLPLLLREEDTNQKAYASDPEAQDIAKEERDHARVLRGMWAGRDTRRTPGSVRSSVIGTGGTLRAGVLGVNDGLVSNFSLVMGVAGGTGNNADIVLVAGVAGLLAGAFSMAAGEYVSMRSQRDIYEHEIQKERIELQLWPEEEEEELVLIYQAKGLSEEDSRRVAKQVMADPVVALDTMAREELGLDPSQLGSPWRASLSSFTAFVSGALVPILPYIFDAGNLAFSLSAVLSAGALVGVGGLIAIMSGRNAAWGALRMLLAGGAAAAVTFGIGRLIGVSIAST